MSRAQLLPAIVIVIVIAAIVTGLIVSGSPQQQRELRYDAERVGDLRQLSNALSRYYRDTGSLPDELNRLVDGRNMTSLPRDPVSDAAYGYEKRAAAEFSLCASFTHESDSIPGDFWWYSSGRNCFDFDYSNLRLD